MLPKRRTKPKKPNPDRVNRSHQAWVRGFGCSVPGCESRQIEFAHIRTGEAAPALRGGMGIKPSDDAGIPLCGEHHRASHAVGQKTFDSHYGIDSAKIARELAAKSPHLKKMGDK